MVAVMTAEQWVALLLGGGLFGSVVSYLTSRHKPKVDTAQVVITGQGGFIDDLQAAVNAERSEKETEKAARKACEETLRQERMRHDTKEREDRARIDDLLRQNGSMAAQLDAAIAHVWVLEAGVLAGRIPPIPALPYILHAHARPHTIPPTAAYDTGVPGTEVNPPVPDPPDDGQDINPEE